MSYLFICFTEEETNKQTNKKQRIKYINQLLVNYFRSFIFCIDFIYFIFLCYCYLVFTFFATFFLLSLRLPVVL